jgi:hypothetical protein
MAGEAVDPMMSTLRLAGLAAVVGTALSALGAASASAATYTYTGNYFDTFIPVSGNVYSASDRVTISLTFSSPLTGGLTLAAETPTAISISDGVDHTTTSNAADVFNFSTNGSGQITAWQIHVTDGTTFIITSNDFPPVGMLKGDVLDRGYSIVSTDQGYIAGDARIWSETPLPAALPLFATGLGALGLLGWRRKRKNAAAVAAA